ncbi:putative protein transport membrane glycoprotein Sec20 [Aspergillus chevalieri]|uniref:Sec20 C-terminal domain-containing protein n=1 Tax=Aspergillus chevalieri TaxID=182096 RepID=A0A7R7VW17_ASPCH|nr:uncharacterized protein ACHE_70096A [Aspergillus chevalieri]BCR91253.1 hypothetical protein ACHE_70096A [Aspergillus chevalieri]
MSPTTLHSRLKDLSASLGQIHPLVNRLRNFTTAVGQGDEARLELGTEIHTLLKEAEEQMELLRVEVEALESSMENRRKGLDSEKEAEKERVVVLAGRLAEDLKRTRGDFRNAQLQAKRNAELAKRKERELLFSRSQSSEARKQPSEKLTQDDLMVNASNDVTLALKRTHQLMQAELSRSHFAQQTLEQSTAAISSLSESYTSLDTLLSSSRKLANSLLRSQKSDTWYLETAFYIIVGTIAWLLFRRILYGPLWWLVWLPFRLMFRTVFAILGIVGITSKAVQSSQAVDAVTVQQTPALAHEAQRAVPEGDAGDTAWEREAAREETDQDRMIDKVGRMVEEGDKQEGTNIDDISPEERKQRDDIPRNPKKRMYEEESVKDEL